MTHPFQEDITPDVTTGHDVVHAELAEWWNTGITQYNVESYPEATFDQRFASALADAHVSGGKVIIPPRPDYTSSGLGTITKPTVGVEGPGGAQATVITRTGGSGALLTYAPSPIVGDKQPPPIKGLQLVGDGTAGLRGLRCLDAGVLPHLEDVIISGFTGTGAIGLSIENAAIWNERGSGERVSLANNTIGMRLLGAGVNNSLFYHRWLDLRLNIAANQIGIQAAGTALLQGGIFNIICNIDGSNGIAVDLADTAVFGGQVYLSGEQTSGTGGIARRLAAGAYWVTTGSVGMTGCTDTGTLANIWSPFEIDARAHIVTLYPALPTAVAGASAGTNPPVVSVSGNDTRMWVAGGTGSSPSAGPVLVVTYNQPYAQIPYPTITPYGQYAPLYRPYVSEFTTTGFTISLADAPPAGMIANSLAYVCHISG